MPSEGNEEPDQQSNLQEAVKAQEAVSESVTSDVQDTTPVEEDELSNQTTEEQEPPSAVGEIKPTTEANQEESDPSQEPESQQSEPIVLELTSLSSGEKTEVVLPPDPDLNSESQTSPPEKSLEAAETSAAIYKSEAITVTESRERSGIEVRFTEKPSKEWTSKLSSQGFRFSRKTTLGGGRRRKMSPYLRSYRLQTTTAQQSTTSHSHKGMKPRRLTTRIRQLKKQPVANS